MLALLSRKSHIWSPSFFIGRNSLSLKTCLILVNYLSYGIGNPESDLSEPHRHPDCSKFERNLKPKMIENSGLNLTPPSPTRGNARRSSNKTQSINLGSMRKSYLKAHEAFTEDQLVAKEPIAQFDEWFAVAAKTPQIEEPNAMALATASKSGRPSLRMVLLKGYGEDGFRFYTNFESRKGQELIENPWAALNFYWEALKRCVRIEGRVEKLPVSESTEYFQSRPISNQIGASISPQSKPIPNRQYLMDKEKEMEECIGDVKVLQKPDYWGGFILIPHSVEFWQGQSNRVHDRIRFRRPENGETPDEILTHKGDKGWIYERLAP